MTPRRPGQEALSRDRIVAAALKLVDESGLEGHSMRDLASELDVDVSTLYYHVPNKAELYDMVADAVMDDHDLSSVDPQLPPIDQFREAGRQFRAALLRHPNAVPLLVGKPMRSATQIRPVERILSVFFAAGMDATSALLALDSMAAFVLGCVAGETGLQADPHAEEGLDALKSLPAEEFSNTHRVLAEVDPAVFADYHDAQFELGLDAMARGLFPER